MKIKSLKTGKYSLHPAWGPIIDIIKGEDINFDLNKDQINILISYGAIDSNYFDNKEPEQEPEQEPESAMMELLKLIKDIDDESEKKSIIQDWGIVNVGKKISKKNKVDNMIKVITEIIESNKE